MTQTLKTKSSETKFHFKKGFFNKTPKKRSECRKIVDQLIGEGEVALTVLGPYKVELMLAPMVCTPVAALIVSVKPSAFIGQGQWLKVAIVALRNSCDWGKVGVTPVEPL